MTFTAILVEGETSAVSTTTTSEVAGDQPQEGGAMAQYGNIIMMVALVAIFYFFMIRPQSKKQKEIQKFREGLKKGDRVVTAGGIYGKIKEINEGVATLEIANNVEIRIDKASIFASVADSASEQKK